MLKETQHNQLQCSIPCNLCGATSVGVLSLKDRKGAYLRTVICKKCGLMWNDPRPDDEKVKAFYSKGYRTEYKGIRIPKKKYVYRDAKEAVRRYHYLRDLIKKGDRLLDIGAGSGVLVYCLRKLGYEAQGIGPDENHSRYAREVLDVPVITGFAADIEDRATYDMVTLHHVLEHMPDPLGELKRIGGMLKQEGKLVIEVPNAEDISQDPGHRYHKAHLYTFNPETLVALGEKAGFVTMRKRIVPLNGNISVIFQKNDRTPLLSVDLSNNHLKITAILNKHTSAHHFSTWVPYRKALQNAIGAIGEQIAIMRFSRHTDIIDAVMADTDPLSTRVG